MDNADVNSGDVLNGPLSTVGTDIVDADGLKFDLQGVNWFGLGTRILATQVVSWRGIGKRRGKTRSHTC